MMSTHDESITQGNESDGSIPSNGNGGSAQGRSPRRISLARRRWILLSATVIAAFIAVGIWQASSSRPSSNTSALVGVTNQAARAFDLVNLIHPSQRISLASLRGRPVVVNFWASWCVPCRTEMPLLEAAFKSEHGRVLFLGVDVNDTASAARAFLKRVHVTYASVFDANGATAINYGVFGLPTTVFISSSGKVLGRHIGELYYDSLLAALREAFHV